jgi:hypothetical protein
MFIHAVFSDTGSRLLRLLGISDMFVDEKRMPKPQHLTDRQLGWSALQGLDPGAAVCVRIFRGCVITITAKGRHFCYLASRVKAPTELTCLVQHQELSLTALDMHFFWHICLQLFCN